MTYKEIKYLHTNIHKYKADQFSNISFLFLEDKNEHDYKLPEIQ